MDSVNSYQYLIFFILILLLHPPFSRVSCFNQPHHPSVSPQELLLSEEKSRLGSTPPKCYNKCNECHPCMAVQVPSVPNSDLSMASFFEGESYTNYKPLCWKCRCGDRFFNP